MNPDKPSLVNENEVYESLIGPAQKPVQERTRAQRRQLVTMIKTGLQLAVSPRLRHHRSKRFDFAMMAAVQRGDANGGPAVLAAKLGISMSAISHLRRGTDHHAVGVDKLRRAAPLLGVDPDWLIDGVGCEKTGDQHCPEQLRPCLEVIQRARKALLMLQGFATTLTPPIQLELRDPVQRWLEAWSALPMAKVIDNVISRSEFTVVYPLLQKRQSQRFQIRVSDAALDWLVWFLRNRLSGHQPPDELTRGEMAQMLKAITGEVPVEGPTSRPRSSTKLRQARQRSRNRGM